MTVMKATLFFLALLKSGSALRLSDQEAGPKKQLVMDIGMNDGSDALHYLELGYRVVSVEANPMFVKSVSEDSRFQKYLQDGSFTVEGKAIGSSNAGSLDFYTKKAPNDQVARLLGSLGSGNLAQTCLCTQVGMPFENCCVKHSIQMISCDDLLNQYGVPYFMKIDIEGFDGTCLKSLTHRCAKDLPAFITYEDPNLHFNSKEDASQVMEYMTTMGFTSFKNVQEDGNKYWQTFASPYGWGDEVRDFKRGKQWKSSLEALEDGKMCGMQFKHTSEALKHPEFMANSQFSQTPKICNFHAMRAHGANARGC